MKKQIFLIVLIALTLCLNAQEKRTWNFSNGLSTETIANLNADNTNWASNGTDNLGNTNNWKNATRQSADSYWIANGEVIEELRGLKIDIGSNKDNSIHLATNKLRLTRKNTKITFPKLINGQKIAVQGKSVNASATNRGIAPVQEYLKFQANESSSQTNGACIFLGNQVNGSEEIYTFVWRVESDNTDSVDVQFTLTPEGGIDFYYFNILSEQTLDLSEIPILTYGDSYSLPATTNEGLVLSWTMADPTVAAISNGMVNALNVGTTTVTATQTGNDEYMPFTKSFTITVNKAPLTVTANDATKTYGAANPTFSVSYSGFVNGDDSSVLTNQPTVTTTATQSSDVGTYPITVNGAVAANYEMTYVPGTLTITKASQSMALTSIPAQTYGTAAYTLKAGTTTVTATQAGGTNYEAFSKEFTLTVNKAALTITANDASKTYGDANPTLSVSYSGFVNGDDASKLTTQPTITTTATAGSAVGTYPITVSGAASSNYTFTYKAGTLTG